ncbi:hypothetical protein QYH69_05760 [Paraburkholderia sp. SARCC-3016]|uniref:hypothetical protein n=1 Tax=Paraburkholderia sp. SARCC-3016 TaxID=3058611 RepID=UPI002807F397|nr:hypothetical protein [Paraburkholderia sp. SARCC-3016]MDQ7976748.1 hypothetical protein [Paraburkholderia sp. SARCC-3016]
MIKQEWKRFHPSVAHDISGAFDAAIRVCLEEKATCRGAHEKRKIPHARRIRRVCRSGFAAHGYTRDIDRARQMI